MTLRTTLLTVFLLSKPLYLGLAGRAVRAEGFLLGHSRPTVWFMAAVEYVLSGICRGRSLKASSSMELRIPMVWLKALQQM